MYTMSLVVAKSETILHDFLFCYMMYVTTFTFTFYVWELMKGGDVRVWKNKKEEQKEK